MADYKTPTKTINFPAGWFSVEVRPGGFDLIAWRWRGNERQRVVLKLDDYQTSELSALLWKVIHTREAEAKELRAHFLEEPTP